MIRSNSPLYFKVEFAQLFDGLTKTEAYKAASKISPFWFSDITTIFYDCLDLILLISDDIYRPHDFGVVIVEPMKVINHYSYITMVYKGEKFVTITDWDVNGGENGYKLPYVGDHYKKKYPNAKHCVALRREQHCGPDGWLG